MPVKPADNLNINRNTEDFKSNPKFQAAAEKFGEDEAIEAFKKAQEIAIAELSAGKERPEASGQLVEVNDKSEDTIIPEQLGAVKPKVQAGAAELQSADVAVLENRIFELMTSILSGNVEVKKDSSQPFLLTEILNGNTSALKEFLDSSKN